MTPTSTVIPITAQRLVLLLFLLLYMACSTLTAHANTGADDTPLPEGVQFITQVEGVSEYRLDNGLQVLLAPDASKPNVTVNMTYRGRPPRELRPDRHGSFAGTYAVSWHAITAGCLGRVFTSWPASQWHYQRRPHQYFASFASDPETLDWYIRWQADVMVNATIAKEDLDAEMTVVRNEMERGENSPFRVLMQKVQAAAFQWHNYGKSTIGARSDVENVDIEQLRAFYRQYYQPDNASLIVSGRFDVDATLATIADAFAPIPRPERALPPEYTVEPVQDGERRVALRREGGSPLVMALYHIPPAGAPTTFP